MRKFPRLIILVALTVLSIRTENLYSRSAESGSDSLRIVVSDTPKQLIRLGIDAERLWHWQSGLQHELALASVGELKSDFVRIGINGAYEREKGVKKLSEYSEILEVMSAFRKVNPTIDFFASPRPIHEAYSRQEKIDIWGSADNVPFSPFPTWVQEWSKNGTKKLSDETVVPKWQKGKFHLDNWVQFYADYLNLMHKNGFDITYLDVTNEQTIVSPAHTKYLFDKLPPKLSKGVKMPKLVGPSSWSTEQATNWLKSIDKSKDEHHALSVAASHNTGDAGSFADFASEAKALGKEAWNSELHGWTGRKLIDDILNSAVFWQHIRAGYTGIDTWLFYGPLHGRDHTMLNLDDKTIKRTGKYEIFKQVVNNASGGNYLEINQPAEHLETAAFLKDGVLSVWVLNKSTEKNSLSIDMPFKNELATEVEVVRWDAQGPESGTNSRNKLAANKSFSVQINGQSLYFFKLKINNKM